MADMSFLRLLLLAMSILVILIGVILIVAQAKVASKYRPYQGRVVDYTCRTNEDTCRPIVEFESDGQTVHCSAGQLHFLALKRVLNQQVTIYAYPKQGITGSTWNCLVDTGSVFSRPGIARAFPLATLFVGVGIFLLFLLWKLMGSQ